MKSVYARQNHQPPRPRLSIYESQRLHVSCSCCCCSRGSGGSEPPHNFAPPYAGGEPNPLSVAQPLPPSHSAALQPPPTPTHSHTHPSVFPFPSLSSLKGTHQGSTTSQRANSVQKQESSQDCAFCCHLPPPPPPPPSPPSVCALVDHVECKNVR